MSEYIWFGNTSFTQEEIDAIDKAIEATKKQTSCYGLHHLLEERARRDKNHPDLSQDQIDTYLEAKGLKPADLIIPPRTICGSYELDERIIKRGTILPSWWTRGDGAILYMHRWHGTESPPAGWREYAWFQVESVLKYKQVSEWRPLEHYMHKRRYWQGELEEGQFGLHRPTYSVIVKRGEIDLG